MNYEREILHLSFGAAVAHRASGRIGRFVVRKRRLGVDGAWVYFPGDRAPRWVPEVNLEEAP